MKFGLQSHLNYELNRRKKKNQSYSVRSFARDLRVSSSWLSEFLRGKKGVSEVKAKSVVRRLDLTRQFQSILILQAVSQHSRSQLKRHEALKKLSLADVRPTVYKMKKEDLAVANQWYFNLLLELFEVKDYQRSVDWLSRRSGLKTSVVKSALQEMVRLGWLKPVADWYEVQHLESETTFDLPSESIRQLHQQYLQQVQHALFRQPVHEREFISVVLAFNQKNVKAAKQKIRDFQLEFSQQFYSADTIKDAVYQLSVQLVRLDKSPKVEGQNDV